jgi:erythromycin esterase
MKPNIVKGLVILLIAGMSGCTFSESPDELPDESPDELPDYDSAPEIKWLQENAVPFKTTEPGTGYEDLMLLKEIIGDARIVALGEATHGTSEFFTMKHRIVEFLVDEMGFSIFVIEASWPESSLVNDYVQTGEGDPAELLDGLYFWTWDTEEILNMITWMQAHNENPGTAPRVSFFGYDVKYPSMAMDSVVTYLHKVDPEAIPYVDSLYELFHLHMDDYFNRIDYENQLQSIREQCKKHVQEVYDFLRNHQDVYEAASSREEFACAVQSARMCVQAEAMYGGTGERDQYMAENVAWLLDQAGPDAKMIIWAHNAHVGVDTSDEKSMGAYLREQYGNEMVIFGFTFYSGRLNALTKSGPEQFGAMAVHEVEPPPENSCEYYFHKAGIPLFFLDLRGVEPGPAAGWLLEPCLYRYVGSGYQVDAPLEQFKEAVLPNMFDVMVYFQDTSPSHLLRQPISESPAPASSPDVTPAPASFATLNMPAHINPADFYIQPATLLAPTNLGFEKGISGWALTGLSRQDYEISTSTVVVYRGSTSGYITSAREEIEDFGTLRQIFRADQYRGKRVRLSAYVKTKGIIEWAGLWMRVDGPYRPVGIDNMSDRPIQGDTDWTRYEIVMDVPEDCVNIGFGILIVGTGEAWVDDFEFEIVGYDVPVTGGTSW